MKQIIMSLILVSIFLMSCTNDENLSASQPVDLYNIDFNKIEGTEVVNPVTIKITTLAGDELKEVSQLTPKSLYHLVVKGSGATFYRIKASDGIVVTQNPPIDKSLSENAVFTVKATEAIISGLYVNIVPIHLEGKKMLRESPQVFLLP